MRPRRYSDDQIRLAISEVGAGTPLVAMCRKLGVTRTTFYRWRKQFDQNGAAVPQHSRVLLDENHKLKQLVADLFLERQALRESLTKQSKDRRKRAAALGA